MDVMETRQDGVYLVPYVHGELEVKVQFFHNRLKHKSAIFARLSFVIG